MFDVLPDYDKWILLSADLGRSSGLDRVSKSYPSQYINCGIAEQNMVGFAAGLSSEGFTVFASSFAPFLSMRCGDQIRMNLGYMQENVNLVALGGGVSMTLLGNSHFGLEDVGMIRLVPDLTIVCPADAGSVPKVIEACAALSGPSYIRLTGVPGLSPVYLEDYDFSIGAAQQLKTVEGSSYAILGNGSLVSNCLAAADLLLDRGIECDVYDFHTICPLDEKLLMSLAHKTGVVVVEEHFVNSGLGSAILEWFNANQIQVNLLRLGIGNVYVSAGEYQWMLSELGLDASGLTESISRWVETIV